MAFERKWFFSKEERDLRRMRSNLARITKIPGTEASRLKETAAVFSENYEEMATLLNCMDNLYQHLTEEGLHSPTFIEGSNRNGIILPDKYFRLATPSPQYVLKGMIEEEEIQAWKETFTLMADYLTNQGGFSLNDIREEPEGAIETLTERWIKRIPLEMDGRLLLGTTDTASRLWVEGDPSYGTCSEMRINIITEYIYARIIPKPAEDSSTSL